MYACSSAIARTRILLVLDILGCWKRIGIRRSIWGHMCWVIQGWCWMMRRQRSIVVVVGAVHSMEVGRRDILVRSLSHLG